MTGDDEAADWATARWRLRNHKLLLYYIMQLNHQLNYTLGPNNLYPVESCETSRTEEVRTYDQVCTLGYRRLKWAAITIR